MTDSHEQLLERAIAGDDETLTTLLESVGTRLHAELEARIGPRYRGLVGADDILQVTCMEAFLRIRSFTPKGPDAFLNWLRRIADNNLRDAIRELEREKRPSPGKRVELTRGDASYTALIEQIAAVTKTASKVCALEELRHGVDTAMRKLPTEYETALRLFELEGMPGEEVARRMGRSHGAVRMLLARARERLAEVLGSDSRFFSSAG